MPSNINKMQKDIYKDLIPLILNKLLSSDKHYNFTIEVWARELNMINQNYSIIKNHKHEASKILKLECSSLENFYIHAYQSVEYYILTSFRYLKDTGCIEFNKTVSGMHEFIQPNIVNEDMCNYLLKKIFGNLLYKTRANRLTSCFTNLLIDNAKKRAENSEEYKKLFEYMCDITISTKPNKSITSKLNNLKSNI